MSTEREEEAKRKFFQEVWEKVDDRPGARQAFEHGKRLGARFAELRHRREAGRAAQQAAFTESEK